MYALTAADGDGRAEQVTLEIHNDHQEPSVLLRRADGSETRHHGADLFHCLQNVRLTLEADGLLLCCQGARPLVWPSGMDRQAGNGQHAHVLRRHPPLTDADRVDIFEQADLADVGTVREQEEAVFDFHGFDKSKLRRPPH
ncbi:hypothetical protein GCM10029964_018310 [Kibdelosporangium lantanae]